MPNIFIHLVEDVFTNDERRIIQKKIIDEILPSNIMTDSLKEDLFNKMSESELDGQRVLCVSDDGERTEYSSYYSDGWYTFEPDEEEEAIVKTNFLDDTFYGVSREHFCRAVCKRNGYSYIRNNDLDDKTIFLGSREIGGSSIVWLHCSQNIEFEYIQGIYSEYNRKLNTDFLVVSSTDNRVNNVYSDNDKIAVIEINEHFLIDPSCYIKFFKNNINYEDALKIHHYPVFIDSIGKFIYFFGKKMNKTSGTNLYTFLEALFRSPENVSMSNKHFCNNFYQYEDNDEEARVLAQRSRELKESLKTNFGVESSEYQFFSQNLLERERGKIRRKITDRDVFWWGELHTSKVSILVS